jgi:hypothetical protein
LLVAATTINDVGDTSAILGGDRRGGDGDHQHDVMVDHRDADQDHDEATTSPTTSPATVTSRTGGETMDPAAGATGAASSR